MRKLHVAAAALNQIPMAWAHNRTNIESAIAEARRRGVQVLCLSELAITGYGCDDMFLSPALCERAAESLFEVAKSTRGMVVSMGVPVHFRGAVFDCAAVCVDGRVVALVAKRHLAGDGVHYEPRWFTPWRAGVRSTVTLCGRSVPIGDLLVEVDEIRIGHEICEDAWVADRPGSTLYQLGVDIILNPSASHFAFFKQDTRRRIVTEGSRAFGVAYVYANVLGNEAGRIIYDGGTMIASEGKIIAEGSRFSYADFTLTDAVVDIDTNRMLRAQYGSHRPDATNDEMRVSAELSLKPAHSSPPARALHAWERSDALKEEEFLRAISLGLFDYLRKSHSKGFVVSLSGGADSAAVVTLVRAMLDLASTEIGIEKVAKRLGTAALSSADELAGHLLTCVYQSTRNSGEVTRNAASALAEGLGANFLELDVDPVVEHYRALTEKALGRTLSWEHDDIALQNIQSRVRAPSVWMLANVTGALLLSTSNRSEAAVGYATMDGDTSGGLSPIAGIDKNFLRGWLRWMEADGGAELPPRPELHHVNAQAPTAELRPPSESQTDEGDLMPYDVLDEIEGYAIRDKYFPREVYAALTESRPDSNPETRLGWVERFFQLWSRNQWKRERYAPSFHVDDKNLDPKTWCRFPILSSGFAEELAALRAEVL